MEPTPDKPQEGEKLPAEGQKALGGESTPPAEKTPADSPPPSVDQTPESDLKPGSEKTPEGNNPSSAKKPSPPKTEPTTDYKLLLNEASDNSESSADKPKSDNKNDYWSRRDEWSNLFEEIKHPGTSPWADINAFDFAGEAAQLQYAHIVVVLGKVEGHARYAAEALAREWLPERDCRSAPYLRFSSYSLAEIIDEYLKRPRQTRCLVIGAPGFRGGNFVKTMLAGCNETISRNRGDGFKMLFWLTHYSKKDFEGVQGISVIELPSGLDGQTGTGNQARLGTDHYRKLFGAGLQNLSEVIEAKNQLIEQSLVRAAVLFGSMMHGHQEKVIQQALAKQRIHTPLVSKPDAPPIPALDLWQSNRRYFMERAGLVQAGDWVNFSTPEEREAATQVAWEDVQGMSAFFHRLDAADLLLARDRESPALVNCYVAAVAGLTERFPTSLGTNWLRMLSISYSKRQGGETGPAEEATTWKSTLKSILKLLREDKARRLHLYDRLGLLCRNLPEAVVESFLNDLIENDACQLAWRLCLELRISKVDISACIDRILTEQTCFDHANDNDLPPQLLSDAAALCSRTVSDCLVLHAAFLPLLPQADIAPPALFPAQCAMLLPASCIRWLDTLKVDQSAPALEQLAEALPQPLPASGTSMTLLEYWSRALSDNRLAKALQDCDNLKADDLRCEPAMILFKLAKLTTGGLADAFKPLFHCIKAATPPAGWRMSRARWLDIKQFATIKKSEIEISPKTTEERRIYQNAINACNLLVGL